MWILSSEEFLYECVTNKTRKNMANEASGAMGTGQINRPG